MTGRGGAARPLACAAAIALACLATLLMAAPAGAAVQRLTYTVPVTQPDEFGQPVSLDTDVYLPGTAGPHPLVMLFHGGGSDKSNPFDSSHATALAEHGYVVILYSARGHGASGGQTTVIGPKEIRDLFDVAAWALGIGGRNTPAHPDFGIDPSRIALGGYSQGGLHTNLAQAHGNDPALNPYGIHFRALLPGNTPDYTFQALVQNGVIKLSFGVGLLETYLVGTHAQVSPLIGKWVAELSTDQPAVAGGDLCDYTQHDTPTSTTKQDLAFRSPGCFLDQMTPPSLWAQAFDDALFPPDMAISMWRRMPSPDKKLYLSMGGHAAPAAPQAVEDDKLAEQIAFLDRILKPSGAGSGGPNRKLPAVVYWRRDPRVQVPSDSYRYPDDAWSRHVSTSWPPPGIADDVLQLGAGGAAVPAGASPGMEPLAPFNSDPANDPVAESAFSSTPVGTSPIPSRIPTLQLPGFLAAFQTAAYPQDTELSGSPGASLTWTPLSPDSQLVVKLLDRAPDGTLTLLSRGVAGIRGASPGAPSQVQVPMNAISSLIPAGHSLVVWVSGGDAAFYKPFVPSLGGVLGSGPSSTITVPLGAPR